VTAGFDILRDEGEAYVEALRAAGNRVQWERFSQFGHAFINMTAACPSALRAMVKIARDFRALVDSLSQERAHGV
jgi:acetyl esterase